jgi:hypothetical protein
VRKIFSVKLTAPAQAIKFDGRKIKITCLKIEIDFDKNIEKVNQVELIILKSEK